MTPEERKQSKEQVDRTMAELRMFMTGSPDVPLALTVLSYGLYYDGGHHKQWFLETALMALGIDVDKWHKASSVDDQEWDRGIEP